MNIDPAIVLSYTSCIGKEWVRKIHETVRMPTVTCECKRWLHAHSRKIWLRAKERISMAQRCFMW